MEEKWVLNREILKKHTEEHLIERISFCVENFIEQGICACLTFVDADSVVGMMCVEAGAKVREKYKDRFILQLTPQPLEGFLNDEGTDIDIEKMELFEKACGICDVVSGLPSRDRKLQGGDRKHADFILSLGKNIGKEVTVHIDQENNPYEGDTEWFLDKIVEHKMQGRVNLVHCIAFQLQHGQSRIAAGFIKK